MIFQKTIALIQSSPLQNGYSDTVAEREYAQIKLHTRPYNNKQNSNHVIHEMVTLSETL